MSDIIPDLGGLGRKARANVGKSRKGRAVKGTPKNLLPNS